MARDGLSRAHVRREMGSRKRLAARVTLLCLAAMWQCVAWVRTSKATRWEQVLRKLGRSMGDVSLVAQRLQTMRTTITHEGGSVWHDWRAEEASVGCREEGKAGRVPVGQKGGGGIGRTRRKRKMG